VRIFFFLIIFFCSIYIDLFFFFRSLLLLFPINSLYLFVSFSFFHARQSRVSFLEHLGEQQGKRFCFFFFCCCPVFMYINTYVSVLSFLQHLETHSIFPRPMHIHIYTSIILAGMFAFAQVTTVALLLYPLLSSRVCAEQFFC